MTNSFIHFLHLDKSNFRPPTLTLLLINLTVRKFILIFFNYTHLIQLLNTYLVVVILLLRLLVYFYYHILTVFPTQLWSAILQIRNPSMNGVTPCFCVTDTV